MTWRILPGIILSLSLLAMSPGCGRHAETVAEASRPATLPIKVKVAPLTYQVVERTVEVVGSLKGWEEVTVGSKRTGRVARVRHDMGDRVKPGEPLADLETVDSDLNVQQAEKRLLVELTKLGLTEMPSANFDLTTVPSVVEAKVKLDRTKQNMAREKNLIARGAGTSQDFQNAENDQKAAEAGLEIALLTAHSTLANALASKIALEVAKQARTDMEIRTPILSQDPPGHSGPIEFAVGKRSISEGQMVKEGEAVLQLVIEDPLRLWTNVPERFSGQIEVGQDVRIHVSSHPERMFNGQVARINPSVDAVSRTFQVETVVKNPDGLLRPGGFAKASIVTSRSDKAATVPQTSIVRFAGVTKIFLVDGQRVRAIEVTSGLEGDGWVEVVGDLPKEAMVVTDGYTQLADGSPIQIRENEPADESPSTAQSDASEK